jgi:sugar phosphate isomerase/epimerase
MNKLSAFYGEVSQYAKQHDISMDTALKNVKKLGYDYIECYSAEAASNSESKKIIDANGFEVVSFFGSFNFGYDSIEVTKNKIQNFVDLALNADVKKIMPMLGAVRPGDNVNDIMKKMCECINILCEEARRHNIIVTIE